MTRLSVIICTYNPAPDIFRKCLRSVAAACGALAPEIIIVDNNSSDPVSGMEAMEELKGLPHRVLVESTQGLTPARIRGIRESSGELIVFVDDDNFLLPDFFLNGLVIAERNPHIGSFSGQVRLTFETQPEEWTRPYWGMLVHRELNTDLWSNLPHLPDTMPCGAGLFVRRPVAQHYLHLHDSGARAVQLDRSGKSLFSGGDNDLAACACDIGLGVGLFKDLRLDHHIPPSRFTKEYLLRLTEGIYASAIVFKAYRKEYPEAMTARVRWANRVRSLLKGPLEREFFAAQLRGEAEGRRMLADKNPKHPA